MKRRIRLRWSCSDVAHHSHRWWWVAWVCGRLQRLLLLMVLTLPAFGQLTVHAGAPADTFHTPTQQCSFVGSTPLNPPCTTVYSDALGTLFYAVAPTVLTYTLPAPAGTCDLRITAWEPNKAAAGQRVFDIIAQGQDSGPLDLFSLAGLRQQYTFVRTGLPVMNGAIVVQFMPVVGNAVVSSLTLTCQPPPSPPTLTGVPCDAPPDGILAPNLYIGLPDGSCLPLKLVPPVGYVGDIISAWTVDAGDGTIRAQTIFSLLRPVQ